MNNNVRTWLILGLGKLPMEDDIAIEDLLGQKFDEDVFKIATGPWGAKSNVGQPLQCTMEKNEGL